MEGRTVISPEEIKRFRLQMSRYEDSQLGLIFNYFKDDLRYILEVLNDQALLRELKSQNVFDADKYMSTKKDNGAAFFSEVLLTDTLNAGREALIGLWVSLYALQKDHPHPNLLTLMSEISQRGDALIQQILLEKYGHLVIPELRDIQKQHKQHLLEKTQILVEPTPPGCTSEPQRSYINERYVNLIVVSTDEFRQRSQHELVNTGQKHEKCLKKTTTGLENISPGRLFCWCRESQCVPNTVMVSGVPGIGKTTLMQKIVHDWVNGKLFQTFDFVFFSRFRELNKLSNVSLKEMILHLYPHLNNQLRKILEEPKKLLFIFDGLDESIHTMDFRSSELCTDPEQRVDFEVIVVSLVRQRLLKGCSVLITSRPTKLASIKTQYFQRITEVMGFLHADRKVFFEVFFGNKEESGKAFDYVEQNDTLYTFCYIPSYCWIICTVLSTCMRAQPTNSNQLMASLPKTVTQLFVTFVSNILTNHCQSAGDAQSAHQLLESIGRMAEYGVLNHFIVFDKRDLNKFEVKNDRHLFSCFLMESGQPPDVDYTFLHLTLQEFFAALLHYINYDSSKLQQTLKEAESFTDGRAEILIRFLCGLSDITSRFLLKSYVDGLSIGASRHVIAWLRQQVPREPNSGTSTKYKKELLSMFYCLQETRNKALVLECFGTKKKFDFSEVLLTPLDCTALAFILTVCQSTEDLILNACKIPSEGLSKLGPTLHTVKCLSLKYTDLTETCVQLASGIRNNRTLRKLDLSDSSLQGPNFGDLMEALPTSQIEELLLRECGLTVSSCAQLASGIRDNLTLKKLDLSANSLEGVQFLDLMTALKTSRIEELLLENNKLTDTSCLHLATGIEDNQHLRLLDLSFNQLEGSNFSDLMEALPRSCIEVLLLKSSGLTSMSCIQMVSGIRNNQCLRKLDLTVNHLEGPGFSHLMAALPTSRLEEIILERNHLTDGSCIHLALGIRNNQALRKMNLYGNELAGDLFKDLMRALMTSRIEELILHYNRLSDDSCLDLVSGIQENQTLKKLDLSFNILVGPNFSSLMTAFTTSRIEELILLKVGLTTDYAESLVTLSRCPNLRWLNVRRNRISDTGFRYIRDLVMNSRSLQRLSMRSIVMTEEVRNEVRRLQDVYGVKIETY